METLANHLGRTLLSADDPYPHGPRVKDVIVAPPQQVWASWIVAGIMWLITVIIFIHHRRQLNAAPRILLRQLYINIIGMSMVFATTSFLSLWILRVSFLFGVMRSFYEAFTLSSFMGVLYALLGEDSESVVTVLAAQPASKLLSQPPLGCLCRPCESEKHMNTNILDWCLLGTRQFMWVVPSVSLASLWIILDSPNPDTAMKVVQAVSTLSMMIAMWSLLVLYKASSTALVDFHVTSKFVAIKLILIVSAIQGFIIHLAVHDSDSLSNTAAMYDATAKREYINNFALCIESTLLAVLMHRAFPAEEIERSHTAHVWRARALAIGWQVLMRDPMAFSAAAQSIADSSEDNTDAANEGDSQRTNDNRQHLRAAMINLIAHWPPQLARAVTSSSSPSSSSSSSSPPSMSSSSDAQGKPAEVAVEMPTI